MSTLYNKILNAIPLHVGETFIERDVREVIAKNVENELKDNCEHDYKIISQVKIIEPHVCKKCGKIK
jgi:hypothetical protein